MEDKVNPAGSLKYPLRQESMRVSDGGTDKKVGSSFYRGEILNFNPYRDDFNATDFLERYVLKGWMPPGKMLDKGTKITAFGSCFASNITRYLSEIGFNLSAGRDPDIYISRMSEGLVNTYSLLGQFEWALEDKKQPV